MNNLNKENLNSLKIGVNKDHIEYYSSFYELNQENNYFKNLVWKDNKFHYSTNDSFKRCIKCLLFHYKYGIHICNSQVFNCNMYSIVNEITFSLNLKKDNLLNIKKDEIGKSIKRYNIRLILKKKVNN